MNSTFEFSELLTKQQIVSRQCGGPTGAARRTDKTKRDLSPGIPQGLQPPHHFLNLQIESLLLGPVAKTPRNKSALQLTAPVFKRRTHRQTTNTLTLQFPQVTKHAVVESTENQVYPLTLRKLTANSVALNFQRNL